MAANNNNVNNASLKQWPLSEQESLITFESWRSNLLYRLNSDARFAVFLRDGIEWLKFSRLPQDTRGLVGDVLPDNQPNPAGYTAAQKVLNLDLMLQQIANFCPVISRRTIINESTSITSVWQAIKLHYGFQTTGGNFIDFVEIKFAPPERPETLYQRMLSFVENNLLSPELLLTHKGEDIAEYEDMSPTLENLVVLLWLQQLHHNLPGIVKQQYGADLRSKTLASLKPEISLALPSLLVLAKSSDAHVMRSGTAPSNFSRRPPNRQQQQRSPSQSSTAFRHPFPSRGSSGQSRSRARPGTRLCALCKASGREANHFLSQCQFLPDADKRFMTRARQVMVEDDDGVECDEGDEFGEYEDCSDEPPGDAQQLSSRCARVNVRASPLFRTFYEHNPLVITIDTGAETNLIREATATAINCPVYPSSQVAFQADGKTPLNVKGETHVLLTRDGLEFNFSGLIIDDLDVDILAGVPFMEENDVSVRPKRKLISVGDSHHFSYKSNVPSCTTSRRSSILRATTRATIWPGEFLEVPVSPSVTSDCDALVAIEPHMSSVSSWPSPGIYQAISNHIRIVNATDSPQVIKKHAHVAFASPVFKPEQSNHLQEPVCVPVKGSAIQRSSRQKTRVAPPDRHFSDDVILNPDGILEAEMAAKFTSLHHRMDSVFDPQYGTYNHKYGRFEAVVNMGPVKPPQRKGRVPQYSRDKLVELQQQFDELEALGVLAKPESLGVCVEYLNPSFLVRKPNRENEFRFVTAFTEVGKYCKPQPSLMPNVDSTIRAIAQWKYLIKTDLTSAFYQIPLAVASMKYCGIVSPFKGVRCYTRCAMGMPGSETALEELMCRVLGDFVEAGGVAKIADDLYCGGESPEEVLAIWEAVLQRLRDANLKLSAKKTVVAPASTTILGWIWKNGCLTADPHKLATLSTCNRPSTVKGLRSFIGAYKILSRVLRHCASFLQPLDRATHGKKSADKVDWTTVTMDAFARAQAHLAENKDIVLPREDDQLWLITDGASSTSGMGATLYVLRENRLLLAGFFSQQLSPSHLKWFPCEIEGITIAAAVKFFDGFIVQSRHRTQVLTDSKPCVDAYNKLLRGQFSSNVRLSTFLSAACRHHIVIRHIAGAVNLPSDFASRNPVICTDDKCQVCIFSTSLDESVVRAVSVRDILDGRGSLPFTSRKAWLVTQSECKDLRRTKAHLIQGTRPTKKETNIRSVKRYLNKVGLASDGLLVVLHCDALAPSREAIVIPEEILPGLLTALHLRLNHPSSNELSKVVKRYFWGINMDSNIEHTSQSCHLCASLRKVPKSLIPETTSDPPESVGCSFAADIMVRERQKILVVREYVTSLTRAALLPSEKHDDIRTAIVSLIHDIIPLDGPLAVIRTDNAPGFQSLVDDQFLVENRIRVDLGRIKNLNRNPVAERAVQELGAEILRLTKLPGPISPLTLSRVTSTLNSRIRSDGLSSREIMYQRDQFTNEQIPLHDRDVISAKHKRALANHRYSENSKSGGAPKLPEESVQVGDLVYLYSDRDKNSPRHRYLVTSIDSEWCNIRKFVGETLRTNSYKVKLHELYKVPCDSTLIACPCPRAEDNDPEDQSGEESSMSHQPPPTGIPTVPVPPDANHLPLPANPLPSPSHQSVTPSASLHENSSCSDTTTNLQPRRVEPSQQRSSVNARSPPNSPGTVPQSQPPPSVPVELSAPVMPTTGSSTTPSEPIRKSSRARCRPKHLDDFDCDE